MSVLNIVDVLTLHRGVGRRTSATNPYIHFRLEFSGVMYKCV